MKAAKAFPAHQPHEHDVKLPRHHFVNGTLKFVKRHDPRSIGVAGKSETTQELEDAEAEWSLKVMKGKCRYPQL